MNVVLMYLKNYGLLENSSRGIWALTPEGLKVKTVDKDEVRRAVAAMQRKEVPGPASPDQVSAETSWEEDLLEALSS